MTRLLGHRLELWEGQEWFDPVTREPLFTVTVWMPMDVILVPGYGAMSVPSCAKLQHLYGLGAPPEDRRT